MSRIVIKNLPKNITEKKLRDLFEAQGAITDIQLKYTKEGVFRQFAFIGYSTEHEAQSAIKYFNNSCIQTSRIRVETCSALGAQDKPQSWSKHSKDSNSFRKTHGIIEKEKEREDEIPKTKTKKGSKLEEILGDHKNDPQFVEFMQAHDKNRTLWANDAKMSENADESKEDDENLAKDKKEQVRSKSDDEESAHDSDGSDEDEDEQKEAEIDEKLAEKPISDLEYMKSLVKTSENKAPVKKEKSTKTKNLELYTIKIYNLPYKVRHQEIIKFFKPLKPFSLRMPSKVKGFCYVGFKTEKEFNTAMMKDKSFIKGKQVFFSDFTEKNKVTKASKEGNAPVPTKSGKHLKWQEQEESIKNEEDISESGKIFFRNLAYTVVDDDLQKLFEKYGPVAELDLPVDPVTRKIKGFGTVTFLMPEHAVRAFSELDGTDFHGRLLHLIPGKTSNRDEEDDPEEDQDLSWKEKKERKLKKSAQQTYNWNSLFLGANAVADILARQYETTKENILDSQTGGSSAAVRLALGETQIVIEMKRFLEENGVCLDVFESQKIPRSKTIILAKNLPADTTVNDLQPLFAYYGPISRFVFPPSGVTALIEFTDATEARTAFKKLAYSKFKHQPLYLEWAPEGTFKNDAPKLFKDENIKKEEKTIVEGVVNEEKKTKKQLKKEDKERRERELQEELKRKEEEEKALAKKQADETKENGEDADGDDYDDEEPEPATTIFLRNLNFNTKEEALRNHFKHMGRIHMVQVATKKDPENPKNKISLGYGFIQFKKNATAEKTLRQMQFTQIEGNQVELKRSDRTLKVDPKAASSRKVTKGVKQTGTKIIVRNIPFQANADEVRDIFKAFGEIRSIRLPLKMTPGEKSHRGFGFVDFITKSDAKKAFDALCQSTHLYGRRLVLEWAATTEDNVGELRKRTAQTFQSSGGLVKRSKKGLFDTSALDAENIKENQDEEDF